MKLSEIKPERTALEDERLFRTILVKLAPHIGAPLVQDPSTKSIFGGNEEDSLRGETSHPAYVAKKGNETLARILLYPGHERLSGKTMAAVAMKPTPTFGLNQLEDLLDDIPHVRSFSAGTASDWPGKHPGLRDMMNVSMYLEPS